MNILITGVGPHNKGAELMLLAILDQLRRRMPEARAVINPIGSPYRWRAKYGLYQLFDRHQSGRMGWVRDRLFHEGYRKRFGMVIPEDIDVVLDASGYAFADAWKVEWVEASAKQIARYKKLGAKVILLAQAFGPFGNERIRYATKRALVDSDMVFARDCASFAYCRGLVEKHAELHLAPDFTNLVSGCEPEDWVLDEKQVAVIPNEKMLTHTDRNTARRYLPAICEAIEYVSAAGYHPIILVHESQDMDLALKITSATDANCPIYSYENPVAIKGIVRRCAFVLSSRYHGLVNSLSQGVPAITIGWTHKYYTLLKEYDFEDGVWTLDDRESFDPTSLDIVLNEHRRMEIANVLRKRSHELKVKAQGMWDKVEGCIDN